MALLYKADPGPWDGTESPDRRETAGLTVRVRPEAELLTPLGGPQHILLSLHKIRDAAPCAGPCVRARLRAIGGPPQVSGHKITKTTPCKVEWAPARNTCAVLRPGHQKKNAPS